METFFFLFFFLAIGDAAQVAIIHRKFQWFFF